MRIRQAYFPLRSTSSTSRLIHASPPPIQELQNHPPGQCRLDPTKSPLTYWHVALAHFNHLDKQQHSCIGLTVTHSVFDGTGLASIIHSLEAEMLGKEWDIPPPPHPGLNMNKLQVVLEKAAEEEDNNATEFDANDAKYESPYVRRMDHLAMGLA